MGENCRISCLLGSVGIILTVYAGTAAGQYPKTPGETFKAFLTACNEGRYKDAESYFSKPPKREDDIKMGCDRITRQGTIKMVEIVQVNKMGDKTIVQAKVTFKNGEVLSPYVGDFIQQQGRWKMQLSPGK